MGGAFVGVGVIFSWDTKCVIDAEVAVVGGVVDGVGMRHLSDPGQSCSLLS